MTMIGQPRHSSTSAALHPPSLTRGISWVAELSVRRPTEGDQIRTQDPAPGGELAGLGGSLAVFDSARRDAHHQCVMPSGGDRPLRPGDIVELRPAAEILATLDESGALDNMPFMPEMLSTPAAASRSRGAWRKSATRLRRRVAAGSTTPSTSKTFGVTDPATVVARQAAGSTGKKRGFGALTVAAAENRTEDDSGGRARATGAGEHSDRA